jgi:hypothetical protein
MGNAVAHLACADHADTFDIHGTYLESAFADA